MKTVENLRLIVKAFEQLPMAEGSLPICYAMDKLLTTEGGYDWVAYQQSPYHLFDNTKKEAWGQWPHLAGSGSFPIPRTRPEFNTRQDQFFADHLNKLCWTGEAGKLRRSLVKHMLAYYRLELAKALPVGFEGFKAFCMTQDSKREAVGNFGGWPESSIGHYNDFMGLSHSHCNLSALANKVCEGKCRLHHNLNYNTLETYGELKRYLQKNYK